MSDLQTFREETRDWLESNCPPEMRKLGDVCLGGRNPAFSHPDQEVWLERMGDKGWTCPCLLYTSPSPRDLSTSRMPSSA